MGKWEVEQEGGRQRQGCALYGRCCGGKGVVAPRFANQHPIPLVLRLGSPFSGWVAYQAGWGDHPLLQPPCQCCHRLPLRTPTHLLPLLQFGSHLLQLLLLVGLLSQPAAGEGSNTNKGVD